MNLCCIECGKVFIGREEVDNNFYKSSTNKSKRQARCKKCDRVRTLAVKQKNLTNERNHFSKQVIHLILYGDTNYNFPFQNVNPGQEMDHIISPLLGGSNHYDNLQYLEISENRRKSNNLDLSNPTVERNFRKVQQLLANLGIHINEKTRYAIDKKFIDFIFYNNVYSIDSFGYSKYLDLLNSALKKSNLRIEYSGKIPVFKTGYVKIRDNSW